MFCRNCGTQLPDNTKFCNHCGAAQDNSPTQNYQSAQPVHTASRPAGAPKKKSNRIIIAIIVIAVAFVIGYFATGADKVKPPTEFDTPTNYEFDKLPSPSINDDEVENSLPDGDTTETGEVKTSSSKVFRIDSDVLTSEVGIGYFEDGTVCSINGEMEVLNTSVVNIDDIRSDAELAEKLLQDIEPKMGSCVRIEDKTDRQEYRVMFCFIGTDKLTDIAELAAAFIGLKTENGKIYIDTAEEEMLGFGYTLE